ncbi:MAG: NUDIX hydrolase [Sedimentisphaerales bacterium]|nr:NUDIX hydrolase [Sedimentisphaerales bacterium]
MDEFYKLKKLTDCPWANLFEVRLKRKAQSERSWIMCSRKNKPIEEAGTADAVVIVATVENAGEKKLVLTKEFRVPIWDFEYGFPAGLIDDGEEIEDTVRRELKEETGLELVKINHISHPVYSSAGLTDESCHMVLAEAKGQPSNKWLDGTEDIEVLLLDVEGIRDLLASNKKIAAKAWGLLYHYAKTGRIEN